MQKSFPELRQARPAGSAILESAASKPSAASSASPPSSTPAFNTTTPILTGEAGLADGLRRLFGNPSRELLATLVEEIEHIELAAGSVLFRQGDPADGLYILEYGRLHVLVDTEGNDRRLIDEVGRGEVVGEMALIDDEPRSATVEAVRDTRLARISFDLFRRIVLQHPEAMRRVSTFVVSRLRRLHRAPLLHTQVSTIAVAWGSPDLASSDFLDNLRKEVSLLGPTDCLRSNAVHRQLGLDPNRDHGGPVSHLMHEAESTHRFVLYDTEGAPHWTRRTARQADILLVVCRTGTQPQPGLLELVESSARTQIHVVYLQDDATVRPTTPSAWADALPEARHHHVRPGRSQDMSRLARRLVGRAFGLVLSGGGARGFAHLGVIKALEEANIPIDVIGGTSMGALIAGQYALGVPIDELIRLNRELFLERKITRDYTLPLVGLVPGRKALAAFQQSLGNPRIEDLWIDYFAVTSDLTQGRQHVFRNGQLWHAVRCSLAVPGIWIPVFDQGRMYADGAIMNNLPVDVMQETCAGEVIAIDVGGEEDFSVNPELTECPSWFQLMWRKVNPLAKPYGIPSIKHVLARSLVCSSMTNARETKALADHYLRPPVTEFGLLEFDEIDRIVERAYRWGCTHLAEHPLRVERQN